MTATMTYTGTLTITSCWCGIHVAIPADLYRQARDGKKSVYCPLGHTFVWGRQDTIDKLRAEADQAKADARWQQRRAEDARREAAEERARTDAARAETNRTRKRLAGGACPCCNRSFTDLARHMNSKHADYVNAPELPAEITRWYLVAAVSEVVKLAGEPLTPPQVLGRLVMAGRRDTVQQVTNALYNAEHDRRIRRTAPKTWTAIEAAS